MAPIAGSWSGLPLASVSVPTRVLTALRVQALALWLLIAPFRLSADYYYRHIPLVSSVAEPSALLGLLVAMILTAAVILVRGRRSTLFFLMTALLPYAVVSNLLFPIGTIFGERLLYLPSVGFCAIMAILLTRPTQRWTRAVGGGIALALLLSWAGRTVLRNPVWHDNLVFAETTVRAAPDSAHAHSLLGKTYADMNRDREAIAEFNRALEIYPDDTDTLFNLGALRMRRGESTEALEAFHRVTELSPTRFAAWVDRAAIHNVQHEFGLALDEAGRAIALRPEAPNGHVMRGYALLGLGRPAEARASFERALRLPRAQPDALLGYGSAALQEGDTLAAVRSFEHLVHVAPSAEAYRGLVASYRQAGRSADAARTAAVGHERFPGDPFFAP